MACKHHCTQIHPWLGRIPAFCLYWCTAGKGAKGPELVPEPELVPVDGGGAPSWATIPAAALVWTEGMETWLPLSTFVPSDPWAFANVEVDVDVAIMPPAASEEMSDVADEGDYYDGGAQDEESPAAAALRALQSARLIIDAQASDDSPDQAEPAAASSTAATERTSVFGQVLLEPLVEEDGPWLPGLPPHVDGTVFPGESRSCET